MLSRGETFEAIRVLREGQRTSEEDFENKLWLAIAYYLAGQHKLFAKQMRQAEEGLSEDPFPSYALGRHQLDIEGRADLAREYFSEALRRSPSHLPSLYHLGWCHELDRRYEEAKSLYRRAEGLWLAHAGLGRLAMIEEQVETAKREAERAVSLRPDSAMVRLLYAQVLERSGNPKLAFAEFRAAAALDPTDASIWYRLSRCARVVGDQASAAEALARYREVSGMYASN